MSLFYISVSVRKARTLEMLLNGQCIMGLNVLGVMGEMVQVEAMDFYKTSVGCRYFSLFYLISS